TFAIAVFFDAVPFGTETIGHGTNGYFYPPVTLDLPVLNWINGHLIPGLEGHLDFSTRGPDHLAARVVWARDADDPQSPSVGIRARHARGTQLRGGGAHFGG